jgi:four helix bundle protein
MYNFEKLEAWRRALELVEVIYKLTKQFPASEKFALSDQLKRAVTSIALNIAEGNGARNKREFAAFCRIALKSLYETIAGLKIAERLYHIDVTDGLTKCDKVSKLLHGLIKYLETKN